MNVEKVVKVERKTLTIKIENEKERRKTKAPKSK